MSYINNLPTSGGATATLSGLDFATYDHTQTGTVGSIDCSTTSWMTGTTVLCLSAASPDVSTTHKATITVAGVVGTVSTYFTFDGARLLDSTLLKAAYVRRRMRDQLLCFFTQRPSPAG